jgi:acyl dehydratase
MSTTIDGIAGLKTRAGDHLGVSDWLEITQDRVDRFADATDDHQWIHVDVERAKTGPFGGTIAHGYLTLSLLIPLWTEIAAIENIGMAVNYGLNKVRFPSPVPVGAKIRLSAKLASVEDVAGNGVQATVEFTVEREGGDKPAVVAEAVYRYYAPN